MRLAERALGRGHQNQTTSHIEHGNRHERSGAAPAVDLAIKYQAADEGAEASTTDVTEMAQVVRNEHTNRQEQGRECES
jgi:hypothetical protein